MNKRRNGDPAVVAHHNEYHVADQIDARCNYHRNQRSDRVALRQQPWWNAIASQAQPGLSQVQPLAGSQALHCHAIKKQCTLQTSAHQPSHPGNQALECTSIFAGM